MSWVKKCLWTVLSRPAEATQVGYAFRESGEALQRASLRLVKNPYAYREPYSRHRAVQTLPGKRVTIPSDAFVAPTAALVGSVTLGPQSSVWYNAVVRGDLDGVSIGAGSNVQDGAVLTTKARGPGVSASSLELGKGVIIGHGAMLDSCQVGNQSLIGMGSVVMAGARVGNECIVGAGAVVLPDTVIPDGELWTGNPARKTRDLTAEEKKILVKQANDYIACAADHKKEFARFEAAVLQGATIVPPPTPKTTA